jgi:hypothetical protein
MHLRWAHIEDTETQQGGHDMANLNITRDDMIKATVSSMDEARAWVQERADAPRVRGTMFFEIDAGRPDCADAVVFSRNNAANYTVEPA